jgi:hypothetical protein
MKLALIVGIDHYKVAPLKGCVNDAVAMDDVLSENWDQSPNFNTRLITSSHQSVSRVSLRGQLTKLFSSPAELALFYFSGHGFLNDLGGYLVTQDARQFDEGVAMSDVLAMANQSPSREVIIILDCCHSGALGAVSSIPKDTSLLRQGVSILCASRDSEAAIEQAGRGLFTALVCEALYGGASSLLGQVTAADVFAFVNRTIAPWDQRPLFKCHVSNSAALRMCNPRIAATTLRLITELFPKPDSIVKLEPNYEYTPPAYIPNLNLEMAYQAIRSYRAVGLIEPIGGASDMLDAAMRGKGCQLTKSGKYYWRLVDAQKI